MAGGILQPVGTVNYMIPNVPLTFKMHWPHKLLELIVSLPISSQILVGSAQCSGKSQAAGEGTCSALSLPVRSWAPREDRFSSPPYAPAHQHQLLHAGCPFTSGLPPRDPITPVFFIAPAVILNLGQPQGCAWSIFFGLP